jgi:hypothetical protein
MRRLEVSLRQRLNRFDELLLSDVPLAWQARTTLIPGRIEFHPEDRGGKNNFRLRWSRVTKGLLGGNDERLGCRTLGFESA